MPFRLLDDKHDAVEGELLHDERGGMVQRIDCVSSPDRITGCVAQLKRHRLGAVADRNVSIDQEPHLGRERQDWNGTHRARQQKLASSRVKADLAADYERLGLRGGAVCGASWCRSP